MTAMTTPHHQVASATAQMRGIADGLVDATVWSMSADEAASTLVELTRLEAQVVELKARVAMHADEVEVGSEVGATSTANWLAHTTRQTRAAAHRTVRLGLRPRHPRPRPRRARARRPRRGAGRGDHPAVKALPDDLDPDLVDPGRAAPRDRGRRARREGAADPRPTAPRRHRTGPGRPARSRPAREGRSQGRAGGPVHDDRRRPREGPRQVHVAGPAGRDAEEDAPRARRTQARAATEGAGVERRPGPERMGRAFAELIERIGAKDLPKVGGRDATIVVTIDLDTLLGRLQKAGVLDTGERISPGEARRLACTARIIPVVLGGNVRGPRRRPEQRFFTRAQQTAHGRPRRRLRRRRMRLATLDVPRPPLEQMDRRRPHRPRQRRTALPPTPRPSPRPHVRATATIRRSRADFARGYEEISSRQPSSWSTVGHEEERAGDGGGDLEQVVGDAGRVADEHVAQHPLDHGRVAGVADEVGAVLAAAVGPAGDAAEGHVVAQDLQLGAVLVLDAGQRGVRAGRLLRRRGARCRRASRGRPRPPAARPSSRSRRSGRAGTSG